MILVILLKSARSSGYEAVDINWKLICGNRERMQLWGSCCECQLKILYFAKFLQWKICIGNSTGMTSQHGTWTNIQLECFLSKIESEWIFWIFPQFSIEFLLGKKWFSIWLLVPVLFRVLRSPGLYNLLKLCFSILTNSLLASCYEGSHMQINCGNPSEFLQWRSETKQDKDAFKNLLVVSGSGLSVCLPLHVLKSVMKKTM